MRKDFVVAAGMLIAVTAGARAQDRTHSSALLRDAPALPASTPTLQEVFGDIGDLLRSADRGRLETLKQRLRETDDELRLLENLKSTLDRGIFVTFPRPLRERGGGAPTPEALLREEKLYEELLAEVRIAESRRTSRALAAVRPEPAVAKGPSTLAQAALGVQLEVPLPPASAAGTPAAARAALDPEGVGRALYRSQDWIGALHAFEVLPADRRSIEVRCLIARCLERTGRWPEAKDLYTRVAAEDDGGPWGDMAQWMLRFGGHLNSVKDLLGRTRPGVDGAPR